MSSSSFRLRPYVEQTSAFRSGESSPRDFLERCIAAIETWEPKVAAFAALDLSAARDQADAATVRWTEGRPLSAIDGMPVGVKDVIETIDLPTGMGSPLFEGWRSGRDSASVFALREAGCVIVGKTVTTEFAATEPGPTRNPHDLSRTPGGSSSGSAAATALGMISAGLGTQVIGSIIRPASYCGCYGYKPTAGAINRGGSHDFNSQSVQGVLAASLSDTWQVMWEIAQRAGGDPGARPLMGPDRLPSPRTPQRLALLQTAGWGAASDEAKHALMSAVDQLRSSGVEVFGREDDPLVEAVEVSIANALSQSQAINAWEGRWPLNTYGSHAWEKLSGAMQRRLRQAEAMTAAGYVELLEVREEARSLFQRLQADYDAAITLAAPDVAPAGIESTGNPIFAVPGSYLGVPALSVPLATIHGLPLNLQLLGYPQRDADAFAVAGSVETALAKPQ